MRTVFFLGTRQLEDVHVCPKSVVRGAVFSEGCCVDDFDNAVHIIFPLLILSSGRVTSRDVDTSLYGTLRRLRCMIQQGGN